MAPVIEALMTGLGIGLNVGIFLIPLVEVLDRIKQVILDIGRESNNE